MSDERTTARARRLDELERGDRDTAVERAAPRSMSDARPGTPRSRQMDRQQDIASEIGVDPSGVATVDQIGGADAFLRSGGVEQFGAQVREDFASEADFVEPGDVAAGVDPREISAEPAVARGRRGDVADRARSELASDDEFARARDFDVEVGRLGVEEAGLSDRGQRRRASRQFESETPLGDVDPTGDLTRTDDGFALDEEATRRSAARGFEDDYDVFGSGELGAGDVRETDDGFGLARDPARELAAADLEDELGRDVSPSDVELRETDSGGFEGIFEGERR